MPTAAQLRDQALVHLKAAKVPFSVYRANLRAGKYPDNGAATEWGQALALLDQIGAPDPPPSASLTGAHWIPASDFATVAGLGYKFSVNTVNPGDLNGLKATLDAADAHGLKLILGLYPEPYAQNGDGSWSISAAGMASIAALRARESSLIAFFVYNEPYWVMKLTAGQLRQLRNRLRSVWPTVKVYHDIGWPSSWVTGGSSGGAGRDYDDQSGVADYVGVWDYPFTTGGYQKTAALARLAEECAFVKDKMGAVPVWLNQSHASAPDHLVFPTQAQLTDFNTAVRAALPPEALISWYVWQQSLYPEYLKKHPEDWPHTV